MNHFSEGVQYAHDVVDNKIVSNKYIKLACQRFLDDLENKDADWYFSETKAQHIHDFYTHLIKHVTGTLAGQTYELSDWESFILCNLFGFVNKDDHQTRRFHNSIVYVARKNSKTTIGGAMVLYHLLSDGEEGAQAFSVATQRDQAKIAWDSAGRMIQKMPAQARDQFKKTIGAIEVAENFNTYKPLGRDSKALDGLNVSFALFDEAAAITDRNMWEVISSSQGARQNYLNLAITTAQFDKSTVFFENYQYVQKVLTGDIEDDSFFAVLYELDEGDDWQDETTWIKANPNLGKSVSMDFLRAECKMAQEIPSKRTNFLVKHMNVYQNSSEAWLPAEAWSNNTISEIDTTGQLWVGVDLGATSDLTALTFVFRNGDKYHTDYQCFIPEDAMNDLPRHLRNVYNAAIKSGKLNLTPGNATDYNIVKEYLLNYTADKDLQQIAYDPWSAQKFSTELLEEGAPMVEVNQSMRHLSPATKDTEIHIRKGELLHLDDAFLQWQFDNCTLYTDVNGGIKVRKGTDDKMKIDAIVALIIAISRASANGGLNSSNFNFSF